jgi:hypothetical protein
MRLPACPFTLTRPLMTSLPHCVVSCTPPAQDPRQGRQDESVTVLYKGVALELGAAPVQVASLQSKCAAARAEADCFTALRAVFSAGGIERFHLDSAVAELTCYTCTFLDILAPAIKLELKTQQVGIAASAD